MAPSELNFITGNANKLLEVKAILGDTILLKNQSLDLVEIQGTVEEVSIDKCKRAAEIVCCNLYSILSLSVISLPLTSLATDRWSSSYRGHMSLLQGYERSTRSLYV